MVTLQCTLANGDPSLMASCNNGIKRLTFIQYEVKILAQLGCGYIHT